MRQTRVLWIIGILLLLVSSYAYSASCTSIVLVTGFEPFDQYDVNPSQMIAETLNGSTLEGAEIIGIVLPVDFNESVLIATQAIEHYSPLLVISIGLDARSRTIKVEKIAMNLKRYQKPDGTWSFPRRIEPSGPLLRLSPLHTKDMVSAMKQAQIPARQSVFAGTYVCNSLFYQLLGFAAVHNSTIKIGFIHVPLLDSQDPQGIPLQTMVDAVKIAIQKSI